MNDRQQVIQEARPSGASIRQRVFGEANGKGATKGDPFLTPFFETAIEHVWGGVWNRPGLGPEISKPGGRVGARRHRTPRGAQGALARRAESRLDRGRAA